MGLPTEASKRGGPEKKKRKRVGPESACVANDDMFFHLCASLTFYQDKIPKIRWDERY